MVLTPPPPPPRRRWVGRQAPPPLAFSYGQSWWNVAQATSIDRFLGLWCWRRAVFDGRWMGTDRVGREGEEEEGYEEGGFLGRWTGKGWELLQIGTYLPSSPPRDSEEQERAKGGEGWALQVRQRCCGEGERGAPSSSYSGREGCFARVTLAMLAPQAASAQVREWETLPHLLLRGLPVRLLGAGAPRVGAAEPAR